MSIIAVLCILGSYLLGAVPFGLVVSLPSGIDVRKEGSKNIGATNVTRLLGIRYGVATLVLDLLKGWLPLMVTALCTQGLELHNTIMALAGAAAIVGHMFPVYLGFRGGKGVATALGVFLYLAPVAVLVCLLVFILVVRFSGFVSLGSLLGSLAVLPVLWATSAPVWKIGLAAFIVFMIWAKHHQNIRRLLQGNEKSWKKKKEQH